MGRTTRHFAALVAAIAAVCAAAVGPAGAQDRRLPRPGVDRYTPLVQKVHSTPRWFRDTNGRIHLAYELMLTNGIPTATSVRGYEGRRDTLAAYGADWLLVDKARPYPRDFVGALEPVYEDERYALYRATA